MPWESKQIFQDLYGLKDTRTLAAYAEHAMVIHKVGRYEEAVELEQAILQGRERLLGSDHPLTLETMNAPGYGLRSLGRYTEAEALARREVEGKQRVVDADPSDTDRQDNLTIAMTNIALAYERQGKNEEAEAMLRHCVDRENARGDHPDAFLTIGNLATVLKAQNKLDGAEKTLKGLHKRRLRVLGTTHRVTLTTLANLASISAERGDQEAAEEIYRKVHNAEIESLGRTHPDSLHTLHNLACTLSSQDRFLDSIELYQEVLDLQDRFLGSLLPETLTTRMDLAKTKVQVGEFDEAESLAWETVALAGQRGTTRGKSYSRAYQY